MEIIFIIGSYILASLTIILFRRQRNIAKVTSVVVSIFAFIESMKVALKVASTGAYSFMFFSIDSLGAIMMLIIAVIGIVTTIYSLQYFIQEKAKNIIGSTRIKQYFVLLSLFFSAMFLAVTSNSPILSWIAIEGTTLSTAFLISLYNKSSAIEAAWKYLIINSIGLLLGFFGTLLYFIPVTSLLENGGLITWQVLATNAVHLDPLISKIAFIFVLIGYGTKVGLVPMHTWKPSAYTKAPTPLGALLSGALLPVAFTIILRFKLITDTTIGPIFGQNLLIGFGLISIVFVSFVILALNNYKRLLAYSSIENAGMIALGFGFGKAGIMAALLHTIYHSLVKSSLFLSSGNILLKYHSARLKDVRGVIKALPLTAICFTIGFLAITGTPPFGMFLTKILIMTAGIKNYPIVSVIILLSTALLFIGFFKHTSAMIFGEKPEGVQSGEISIWLVIPQILLLGIFIILSFYIPPFLQKLLNDVVTQY